MTDVKKPSEKIVSNNFDGKEITDSVGRKLRLKKPDIVDQFDLLGALGEHSNNDGQKNMALSVLYIATIDNLVVESPKTYSEIRAALRRIGDAGLIALTNYINSLPMEDEREATDKLKK